MKLDQIMHATSDSVAQVTAALTASVMAFTEHDWSCHLYACKELLHIVL